MSDYKIKMAAQTADYQRRQREEAEKESSSEIDVNPIRAARAAAFDAARREVKSGSAIDAEAVIATPAETLEAQELARAATHSDDLGVEEAA